jgi:type I restriction enzyme S subunit
MANKPQATWRRTSMRDAVTFFASGEPFLKLDYASSGIPVLAKGDVKPFGRVAHGERRYLDASLASARGYRRTRFGDYLLTTRDLTQAADFLGLLARIPDDREYLVNQGANVVRFRADIDGRFVVYWCNGPIYRSFIKGYHVGSTQIHIRKEDFLDAPLWLPPSSEQKAIGHILGSLDDKIELNRQMNKTLEAMALAVFKAWFVDFDPVRAKAAGAGLRSNLADLFPDSFARSELGDIPEGWTVGSLLSSARLLSGGTPKTDRPDYWNGPISWASAKDVSQSQDPFLIATERTITPEGVEQSATQLLPPFASLIVARGATTGRMVLSGLEMAMNQTCYALVSTVDTPFALYCQLCAEIGALVHSAHGSVFDTITTRTFESSRAVCPPVSLLKIFEEGVAPLFLRLLSNVHESRTLAGLRDTLLPKLISGQLRIKDAERIAARAL